MRPSGALAALLTVVLLVPGCAGDQRPAPEAWEQTWDAAQALVPSRDMLDAEDARTICQRALGELRTVRQDLLPSPDELLDEVVDEWLIAAEHLVFTCPGPGAARDDAIGSVARWADEVETALGSTTNVG